MLLVTFELGTGATNVVDVALVLAVKPHEALPTDSTLPPLPTQGELGRQELGDLLETRQSFCMTCNIRCGKLCGAPLSPTPN